MLGAPRKNGRDLHRGRFLSPAQSTCYQMITRSFGARYILSPGLTPKAS